VWSAGRSQTTTEKVLVSLFCQAFHPGQYQIKRPKQGFKQVDLPGLIVKCPDHLRKTSGWRLARSPKSVPFEAAGNDQYNVMVGVSTALIKPM